MEKEFEEIVDSIADAAANVNAQDVIAQLNQNTSPPTEESSACLIDEMTH